MKSALVVSLCCVLMGACTTIKLNDDNTNTITHEAGEGVAQDLATRACHRAGERRAVIISTMNKDPSKPEGTGRQVTTFRCTSQDSQTPSQ
jgi:hypothetical protein